MEAEVANLKKYRETDRMFHKEDKVRMHKQVEALDNMNKKYRDELKDQAKAESKYRFKYHEAKGEITMLKI